MLAASPAPASCTGAGGKTGPRSGDRSTKLCTGPPPPRPERCGGLSHSGAAAHVANPQRSR
eukprot:11029068-Alexandrium_andersonii.AAC.1